MKYCNCSPRWRLPPAAPPSAGPLRWRRCDTSTHISRLWNAAGEAPERMCHKESKQDAITRVTCTLAAASGQEEVGVKADSRARLGFGLDVGRQHGQVSDFRAKQHRGAPHLDVRGAALACREGQAAAQRLHPVHHGLSKHGAVPVSVTSGRRCLVVCSPLTCRNTMAWAGRDAASPALQSSGTGCTIVRSPLTCRHDTAVGWHNCCQGVHAA